ncbi:retrovirus-related Pol polyprotein from transposon RE1 isoform X2 [Diospyros lotus]|uniref:retrovirus-related Pol polyprotein from transposon RE1 isoform X2 n=1 Tax=Diospyros lotus TaxID=55363 RepID=UPI00225534F4|nr:retrovirus-related Pol polyprotein from transposon RE1 isoform X2 [Diospyros lotus]
MDEASIPSNIHEALGDTNWKNAVMEEMKALDSNNTWELVDRLKNKKIVGYKWVFTVKYKSDGSIDRYKARLVAQGYSQTYGIDYEETFAPVAKLNSIRIFLSIVVNLDWELFQFDIMNAFLNGELEEEVYMKIPPGFENEERIGKVCKLHKSLYGLKQSPRAWFKRFSSTLTKFGYKQGETGHTLFIKHSNGKRCILIVYVDDIIVTGDDTNEIATLKQRLKEEFVVKDLGNMKYFLGMEVARSKEGIVISQRKYTLDLQKDTGMFACKPRQIPLERNWKYMKKDDDPPVDKEMYQR